MDDTKLTVGIVEKITGVSGVVMFPVVESSDAMHLLLVIDVVAKNRTPIPSKMSWIQMVQSATLRIAVAYKRPVHILKIKLYSNLVGRRVLYNWKTTLKCLVLGQIFSLPLLVLHLKQF